ncbi:uncharacterized protein METZ01_LOCUS438192, partial [marine metagenome]
YFDHRYFPEMLSKFPCVVLVETLYQHKFHFRELEFEII